MSHPLDVPADVRLMQLLTQWLLGVLALILLWALLNWLARLPQFAIAGVTVRGDVAHNNALTLRANVVPRLSGNFFTVDLAQARTLFESVPWVRSANVQRVFPNRLRVTLEEHQAVALWGSENESRLVNSLGEVFEANLGDVEDEALITLAGPEGSSQAMLAMQQRLIAVLAPIEARIDTLKLSARGSWRAELASGADIELGRGSEDEVVARTERFVRTLGQATQRFATAAGPRALLTADLRHEGGYALRLRGVSTSTSVAAPR